MLTDTHTHKTVILLFFFTRSTAQLKQVEPGRHGALRCVTTLRTDCETCLASKMKLIVFFNKLFVVTTLRCYLGTLTCFDSHLNLHQNFVK